MAAPSPQGPSRPLMRLLTKELVARSIPSLKSFRALAEILFELQFRERKKARELRAFIVDHVESHPDAFRFPWPSTDAPEGDDSLDPAVFEHEYGLLKVMGYTVGLKGLGPRRRRAVLEDTFLAKVPPIHTATYMKDWGAPNSGKRLKKMADSIASFTRSAKRSNPKAKAAAISDWEADLRFLKRTFYDGRFDFKWPATAV